MFKYILLGVVQGITEFLPVSSSAHLAIMQKLLGITGEELVLSIVLHLGTLFSLVIFFFKDILSALSNKKLLSFILITAVITGIIGFLGKDFFEKIFSSTRLIAFALICTGIILILTKNIKDAKRTKLDLKDAIILGFIQGIAVIPGISRSGITISGLLFRKIEREASFRFCFLMAMPVILGAAALEAKDIGYALMLEPKHFIVGFVYSFLSGILSLSFLKIVLQKAKLYYFGYYCILAAIFTLLFIR
ncbi:MAG: undecaprenyl-diphosphate phosphatase [Candidatus Omnitrophica bacterium]|nr:undecaprenyl-diphosphate phosphatase [Candidatus Omnitrophota bacterium]